MTPSDRDDVQAVARLHDAYQRMKAELSRVIVGQAAVIDELLIALFARGHCLLEGVPGLAKTLMVRTLAGALTLDFRRIQFTPDLMPADVTGTEVIQEDRETGQREFRFLRGPLFGNVILADEINRAPPKTQAALLEAMQEYQVTAGGRRHALSQPFFVLATQNPIEQEGTYPLPEAQVDRFMLKLLVDYPSREEERTILDRMSPQHNLPRVSEVLDPQQVLAIRQILDEIYMDDKVKDYVVALVHATRRPQDFDLKIGDWIEYGASPRATIYLTRGARAMAFLAGRGYVTPQDVKDIAPDVLRHRIIVSYEAEAEEKTSDDVVRHILDHVPVP